MKKTLNIKMIPTSPVKFSSPSVMGSIQELDEGTFGKVDFNVYLPFYNRNLQRELCWSLKQKQAFVISILQNKNLPPLSVNYRYDTDTYEIIDGKQRLSTAISFYRNEFPIVIDGEEFFYKDFDEDLAIRYKQFNIKAFTHYDHGDSETHLTDEKKIAWFLYVNATGTPQQDAYLEELRNI